MLWCPSLSMQATLSLLGSLARNCLHLHWQGAIWALLRMYGCPCSNKSFLHTFLPLCDKLYPGGLPRTYFWGLGTRLLDYFIESQCTVLGLEIAMSSTKDLLPPSTNNCLSLPFSYSRPQLQSLGTATGEKLLSWFQNVLQFSVVSAGSMYWTQKLTRVHGHLKRKRN